MKEVLYKGRDYYVPDWCSYISKDEDSALFAHEFIPELIMTSFKSEGRMEFMCYSPDWRDSVEEYSQ